MNGVNGQWTKLFFANSKVPLIASCYYGTDTGDRGVCGTRDAGRTRKNNRDCEDD